MHSRQKKIAFIYWSKLWISTLALFSKPAPEGSFLLFRLIECKKKSVVILFYFYF